jgi:phenol hydroxylase P0 protein
MGSQQPPDSTSGSRSTDSGQAYVRVLGTRSGKFVEFEYSLGDGDLAVELILPFLAFAEFCAERKAVLLPPAQAIAADLDQLAWRAGKPGLLRRPEDDSSGT